MNYYGVSRILSYAAGKSKSVGLLHHGCVRFNHTKMVAVEGNIGSGKTSCMNYFGKDKRVDIHSEPVGAWRNVADTNALDLLYKDPQRWSFLFNQLAMLGRFKVQLQTSMHPIKMVERSIYSSHHVFVLNNYKQKDMSDLEFKVAEDWFNFFSLSSAFPQISHFIYLRSNPELCLERINKRDRPEENKLSLEFLTSLHHLHEELFVGGRIQLPGSVYIVDATKNIKDMEKELEIVMENLLLNPE